MIQRNIGTTIIYITHDQEASLQLCDRIAIMRMNGEIAQIGTDEEIIKNPIDRYVYSFIGVSNFIPASGVNGRVSLEVGSSIPLPPWPRQKRSALSGPQDMGVRPMNIVFDSSSPVRGTIRRAVFLGNQYNYFVTPGQS